MYFALVFMFFNLIIALLAICSDERDRAKIRHLWHKALCRFGHHQYIISREYSDDLEPKIVYGCKICRYCGDMNVYHRHTEEGGHE